MDTEWKSKGINLAGSNLCRLCAKVSNNLSPIFNLSSGFKEIISLQINKCLPKIKVEKNDSKPLGICVSCISKLNVCEELIESSMLADNTFDEILKNQPSVQENMSNIDQSLLKGNNTGNCFWVDPTTKNQEESMNVPPQGSVLVVSKLAKPPRVQPDEDYVVMLQVKYKDDQLAPHSFINSLETPLTNNTPDEKKTINHLFGSPSEKYFLLDNPLSDGKAASESYPLSLRVNSSSKMVCKLCGAKFSRMSRLRAHHIALHTDTRPYPCDQCEATFAVRWDLTLHQRLHARTFQCDFCEKTFIAQSKLDRHRRTHTGERPFSCPHCGKAFAEKRNLENHIRTHTGERPFQCEVCFKTFRVRTHLTEHQRVHAQLNKFTCNVCGKPFRWKANYTLHMKTHALNRHPNP